MSNDDTTDGAIDHDYDENELSSRQQLQLALDDIQQEPVEGGIALDLVTRQPLFVRRRVADDLAAYHDEEGFDLASYKQHPWLPISVDDAVYECVFIPRDAEGLHKIKKTYDYPRGRLATVPLWTAWEDDDA